MRLAVNRVVRYNHRFWTNTAAVAAVVLSSVACSGSGSLPRAEPPPLSSVAADPKFVLTVELSGEDTLEGIEQLYGGDVLVWEAGKFALVGLQSLPKEGEPGYDPEAPAEANERIFFAGGKLATSKGETWAEGRSFVWAGGRSFVWAGGRSFLWAGGRSFLWAGGEYSWMPENTGLWNRIGLQEAHQLAPNMGNRVTVAIIDTGVDLTHPALSDALAPRAEWWDFYDNDGTPQEQGQQGQGGYGHGTNVAGIIRQVAPAATILPIRALGPDGQGDVADLAAGIDWAVARGADVINLSLGADHHVRSVDKALRRAAERGVYVVSSTGNSGDKKVTYPATSASNGQGNDHMVSVTAVDDADVKAEFATYKPAAVELAAPGVDVYGPAPGKMVAAWSGTSMAAPMVAGALALALGEPLAVDRALLGQVLEDTTFDIYSIAGNTEFANAKMLGSGRLDIHAFVAQSFGVSEVEGE